MSSLPAPQYLACQFNQFPMSGEEPSTDPCVQPAFSRAVILIHLRGLPSAVREGGKTMLRLIAVAGFFAFATSAQAMSPAPLPHPDGMITQVRLACGPGRTRVGGVCVARTTIRHVRRGVRRGYY